MSRFTVFRGSLMALALAATALGLPAQERPAVRVDRTDAGVAKALSAKTDVDALNVPLQEFLKTLAQDHGIAIRLDKSGLKRARISPSIQITASFKEVPLGVALRQILRPLKLQYRIERGAVVVDDVGLPLDAAHPPGTGPIGPQPVEAVNQQPGPVRIAPAAGFARAARVNNDAVIRQQLRLLLQVELKFAKRVCAPTAEQMNKIKQEALTQIVGAELNQRVGNNVQQALNDARRSVQQKVAELLRAHLSPEQIKRYEGEIQLRDANLRQACARNLIVAIDQELSLTEWQRQKLSTELAGNWDDSWTTMVVLTSMNNNSAVNFLPNVPDELVVPYLDAIQRSLWGGLQKRENGIWGGMGAAFLGMGPPALDTGE